MYAPGRTVCLSSSWSFTIVISKPLPYHLVLTHHRQLFLRNPTKILKALLCFHHYLLFNITGNGLDTWESMQFTLCSCRNSFSLNINKRFEYESSLYWVFRLRSCVTRSGQPSHWNRNRLGNWVNVCDWKRVL